MATRLLEALSAIDVVDLTAKLVRIPSSPGIDRQEEAVVTALAGFLENHGLPCRLVEVRSGRPNLYCAVQGRHPGRSLMLCGHTDTVPLNRADPGVGLSGELRDGHLHGRGTTDMKGALAAMAAALVALHRTGSLSHGEVTLAAVIDEEMQSLGAEYLVRSGERADGAIVGEATENRIAVGHKGLEWLEIEIQGRAAHGGTPEAGTSAIVAASKLVSLFETELRESFSRRKHPVLGPPTLNVGTIQGGDQPSTVPARCTLRLDRRTVPGETYDSVVVELRELLERIEGETPGLRTSVRRVEESMATLEHIALLTPPEHPLVQATLSACREAQATVELTTFPAWSDGALLAGYAHIPSIVLGPGSLALAHSPYESVPVAALEEAARIYALTAVRFSTTR